MKKSKISILLLLLVMILSISAVSAADIDNNSDVAVQAIDEVPIEEVASEGVDPVAATNDADVLATDEVGNFTDLQSKIDSSGSICYILNDYTKADNEDVITISKDISIIARGDNFKIDANNNGGIFKINPGVSVFISGLTLVNGNSDNGAAVYNEGDLVLDGCTFSNNNAAQNGGAIYNTATLEATDCTFTNNVATYRGGAVYNEGGFDATGSTFDGNDITFRSANDDNGGAAVYNNGGTVNLITVNVINNIKNIVYREGNSGDYINAAIVSFGRLYIDNSYIANNSGSWGGGVYVRSDETFTVTNTVFEDNVATFGAAIYDEGSFIVVENCNFTNNHCEGVGSPGTANTQAAAILVMAPGSSAIITDSRFNRNSARVGGAISISEAGDVLIDDCEFVENTGYSEGGAIYNYAAEGTTLTVKDSTFVDNVAPFGSAISNDRDLSLSGNTITGASTAPIGNYFGTIESELFVNILQGQTVVTISPTNEITAYITDDNGNAVIDRNLVLLVDGNEVSTAYNKNTGAHTATYTFTNPGSYEVAAKDYDATHTTPATIVFESPLSSLQALIDANTNGTLDLTYGFTYLEDHDSAIKDIGVVISKNIIINGNGVIIDGASASRLFTVNDGFTLTLNDVIITNGAAEKGAGVYVSSGAGLLANDVNFINNTAVKRGGAIYSEGTVNVDNCVFDSNDITFRTANDDNGGAAIYNLNGVLTIENTNITNNLKDIVIRDGGRGDLIVGVVVTSGETIINNAYFANNAGSWGGAISSLGYMNSNDYVLTVIDSRFEGNNATFGGAIFVESSGLDVRNCIFENNKGVGVGSSGTSDTQGGAIVVFPSGASAEIIDSTFIDNSAKVGGAVSFAGVGGDSLVDNCTFIDNAANDGGAVYIRTQGDAVVTVENSEFEGNTAGWGSAISTDGNLKLSNNNISGDAAAIGNWAGSITSELTVTVLDGETHTFIEDVSLYAVLTDDNGNLVVDHTLKFYIDELATSYGANFNSASGRYERSVAITTPGTYTVTVTSDSNNLTITTGTIVVIKKGSFTDLQYQLDNFEGDTLELSYDFIYNETVDSGLVNGIVLDQGISIDGKGHTISGNNQARVFNVTSNMISLSNMTIRDGKADKGAGLYINKGEFFMAENVNFINNTATYRGGAIYTEGLVGINDCVIDSNDITYRAANDDNGGAAIYNNGGIVYINNTAVTNNLKDIVIRDGNDGHLVNAVIFNFGGAVIINNSYVANNTGSWGAGIYQNEETVLEAYNTVFEGNNATFGSAIYNEGGKLTVDNCTFNDNAAVGIGSSGTANTQGAAILVMDDGSAEITNSKFNRNTAKVGGAVSFAGVGEDSIIDNCTFTDNVGSLDGGAVYLWSDGAKVTVTDSEFIGNDAGYGGAIENEGVGALVVDGCTFVENTASVRGGAIISSGNTSVSNSVFDNNEALGNTNAIYLYYPNTTLELSNNTITGSDEAQIYVKDGIDVSTPLKVIILDNGTYNIHMSPYTLNATVTDMDDNLIIDFAFRFVVGDAVVEDINIDEATGVYTAVFTPSETGTFIVSSNIEDASEVKTATLNIFRTLTDLANLVEAATDGDTIVLDGDYAYNAEFDSAIVDGIVIDKYVIIDGNGSTITGSGLARIFNVSSGGILGLTNMTIRDAKADKGAAVYVDNGGSLSADNVKFINNTATYRGGAVYTEGKAFITDSLFDSNDITFRTSSDDNGGAAIYNLNGESLIISNTNFTNNLKDIVIREGNNGDLLVGVVVTSGDTWISESYFANNTGSWGGAISSLGYMNSNPYTLHVMNSKFEGNNATFGGAIFVESSNLDVENCTFENNKGVGVGSSGTSNTQGGAIVVFPDDAQATIVDSTFINNSARCGGAVSFAGVDSDSLIDNCTFIDNIADDGGAFYFWSDSAVITVTDSDFINNVADYGGAIENEGGSDLIVDNCNFVENYAVTRGGAIISSASTSVSNSVFEDNEAPGGSNAIYLWYPDTTLALSNNTITGDAVQIYTKAGVEIINPLNATFLNNKTIPAEQGNIFILNATLTDDKGNFIYDADFRFSVNGETIDDISFDKDTGLYTVDYYIGTAGSKVISTNYEATGLTKYTGVLDVPKANVTEFTVTVPDTLEGDNATVWVTLIGVNETGLNDIVTVIINNKEYAVIVENGTGTIAIEDLAHGQYPVVAMFDGNSNYESAINSTVFYVKGQSKLNIAEITTAEYGDVIEITINLTDSEGNPLSGVVVIDNLFKVLIYEDGIGTFVIDSQPDVGNYTFQAVYDGNDDYFGYLDVFNVTVITKVIDPNDVVVEIPNINEFGEAIPVTITSPVDGTYTVNINGTAVNVEVVNGTGSANITLDKAGIYNATVDIAQEGYSLETITTDYFEYLVTPDFHAVITGTYPNAEISITGPAGTYHVDIDGRNIVDIIREESGLPTVCTIEGIDAGNYTAFVSFDSHDEYYGGAIDVNFTVAKADSKVTIEPITNVTYGNPVVIVYHIDNETDFVTISINKVGNDISEEFIDSQGTITANLPAGTYIIRIHNGESENYNEAENQAEFTVAKAEALTITVEGDVGVMGGATVNVTVASDATGYIIVDNNGVKDVYELVNGSYAFEIYDLEAGEYTITVTYLGDDNYNKTQDTKVLNIPKSAATPNVVVVTPEIKVGQQAELNVTMDNNHATGFVRIYVDGEESGFAELDADYANATIVINDLANGTHTIGIKYVGNNNFNESDIVNVTVDVVKGTANPVITDVTTPINVGDDATFVVSMDPNMANGNVTVFVDGVENQVVILDGEYANASVTIKGLTSGTHTIGVRYNGNDNFEASEKVTATISVNKQTPAIVIVIEDVGDLQTMASPWVNITVAGGDATGNIRIEGREGEFALVNGVYAFQLTDLLPGNYNVTVKYLGDDKYESASDIAYYSVSKAQATPAITDVTTPINVGDDATFVVSMNPDMANGNVTVFVDGVENQVVILDGEYANASVTIKGLTSGTHVVAVQYNGNDNFEASEKVTATISVNKEAVPENAINITEPTNATGEVINVNLPEDATGNVSVIVNGQEIANVPVENGNATIPVGSLPAGSNVVEVKYSGDDKYDEISVTKVIVKEKIDTVITVARAITQPANDYHAGERGDPIVILLQDANGNPLANKTIQIAINGPIYNLTTDENGIVRAPIGLSDANVYTYAVSFKGDETYNAAPLASCKLTLTLKTTSISASAKTFKANAKTKTVTATLKVSKNKYDGKTYLSAGKKITLKVNGKTYTAKANAKGVVKFNIKLTKKGKYTATIKFAGDKTYKGSSKSIKITIK